LSQGRLSTLYKLNLADPRVAEIAARAGVSALWLCNEHVSNDWLNLENQIRAAALHDTDVIVRVSKGSYSDYIRPIEAGAAGIMVPHVTTAEEAKQIVKWTKFHPIGERPMDGGNADGGYAQIPTHEYVEFSNHQKMVIVQIESPEGVLNVDSIAAVEGIDLLMFGPGDYAHLLGKAGEINDPAVLEARQKVEAAALAHGKRCVAVAAPYSPEELLNRGYSLVHTGADVVSLNQGIINAIRPFTTETAPIDPGSLYGKS
tara:strand:+ start:11289 stop:12065 length:777 start_codon:yes stop_codon:yes gene_type:complete